jgi:hypothetical protein
MEAVSVSEMLVNFYQTTRRNNPEDTRLHSNRNFGFHKMRETSWLAEWLSASQEWPCSMELVRSVRLVYGLDDRSSIPNQGRNFSLLYRFQTGSGTHPALYPMGTGFFPRVWSSWNLKLPIHSLTLVPRKRISGALHPLPTRLHSVLLN